MAVTITLTANPALTSDLLLSGTCTIEGALDDGTENIAVSMYNKTTGATFTGTAQVYESTKTLTFAYANGTSMSVNLSSGTWVYQRLSTELDGTTYSYIFTFEWTDAEGAISETIEVDTRKNIVLNTFTLNDLDDIDKTVTGTFDVDIISYADVTLAVTASANGTQQAGTAKKITSETDVLAWTFVDSTSITIDIGNKSFTYTRPTAQVNDKSSDAYAFTATFNDGTTSTVNATSEVGYPPTISSFVASSATDTDVAITGDLKLSNATGVTLAVNVTNNGVLYKGENKTVADSLTWNFADGSSFKYDGSTNTWSYTRVAKETQDLLPDLYSFEAIVTNKYGSDSASAKVQTTIPKATIVAFSADSVADSDKTLSGVLKYELPSIANNPTIALDVSVNGVVYSSGTSTLLTTSISFEYANGSTLIYTPSDSSFVYTRASDDYSTSDADTYSFDLTITVNGEAVTRNLTVKTMAGQRVYDYEPAYPVVMQAGSVETQRTAWTKYIEENKRMYRLLNENLNYYENIAYSIQKSMQELQTWIDNKFADYDSRLEDMANTMRKIGIRVITGYAYHGAIIPIPQGSERKNCKYIVSLRKWDNTRSDNKYCYDMYIWVDENTGQLTCYTYTSGRNGTGGTYKGHANYMVIDVTSIASGNVTT